MDIIKKLQQVETLDNKIEMKNSQILNLSDAIALQAVQLKEVNVLASGNQDRLADTITKIIDLENEKNEFIDKKFEIIRFVEKIQDANAFKSVYLKYINKMSIKEIEDAMVVSRKSVYRYLDLGLNELEKIENDT